MLHNWLLNYLLSRLLSRPKDLGSFHLIFEFTSDSAGSMFVQFVVFKDKIYYEAITMAMT